RKARADGRISSKSARLVAPRWNGVVGSGVPRLPAPGRGRDGRLDGRKGSSLSAMKGRLFSAANCPEFHRQARKIPGDVDRHTARVLELLPELVRLIEFEVGIAGVERNLPECHGNRN